MASVRLFTGVALAGLLLASGCTDHSRPSPTPTVGKLTGAVTTGCFKFVGPPSRWTVTIKASQHGVVKGSTVITEVTTRTKSGETTVGQTWTLTLPPGVYDITYAGPALTSNGRDTQVGSSVVRSGRTTTAPRQRVPNC